MLFNSNGFLCINISNKDLVVKIRVKIITLLCVDADCRSISKKGINASTMKTLIMFSLIHMLLQPIVIAFCLKLVEQHYKEKK